VRVLELGGRVSTAWCARLFAGYGADVVTIEPDGGHVVRSHPPFDAHGTSIAARYLLGGRSAAIRADLDVLARDAHVIVTDVDAAALAERHPHAIVVALTPHGLDGDRADLPGNDLTASAWSGWASVNGTASRTPLKGSGYQASYQAGTFAFGVAICALVEMLATGGAGQIVDVAEAEVLVSTFAPAPLRYQYSGFVWPRKPALDVNEGPVPVEDGYFALTISRPAFWVKAMRILGLPDLADDRELQEPGLRPKHKARFADRLAQAMSSWTRMALFDALGRERVIAGPVLRMDEFESNAQFEARGFLTPAESGVRFPGSLARMSRTGWQVADGATPRRSVRAFAAASPVGAALPSRLAEARGVRPQGGSDPDAIRDREVAPTGGPLAGFRGLVLTQAWAGTYATELLALLGADVIQLEVRGRLDSWRGTYGNPIPKNLTDRAEAKHAWNLSPLYNSVNLGKRCITLDLATTEGVDVFKRLVAHADFVAENFSPRVMANFGLDYARLCEIRPDLVMASLSAYGATGPWAHVPGIGGTIEPSSGMSSLLGYPGEHPQNSGQMYPDPVAGLCGFAAIALALLHRDRTGEGQFIDLSMQEANFTFIGDAWLEFAINRTVRGPMGNRHPLYTPHGIFPAQGEDQWIAIAAETDAQWRALCDELGLDAAEWPTRDARRTDEVALESAIASRTVQHDKRTLAAALASRGVPSAPVLDAREVAEDETLRRRGHVVRVEHPEAGPMWQSALPAKLSRTPIGPIRPAPLQGEHSFEVFRSLIGMRVAEYDALVAAEVSGSGPTARHETSRS
jgi:crotonobetainyl-CoA:carnitine CoA-transferase CaiB-like acyl-CoA transferase